MSLTLLGWAVVHSIWQGTFIAGVTAMTLALVRDPRAQIRYLIGCASLALMALTALFTAFSGDTSIGSRVRYQVIYAIDGAIGVSLPAFISWAAIIVPAAGALWLAGLVVRLVFLGVEWRRVRALQRADLHEAGTTVRAVVTELCAQLGLPGTVDVRCSTRATVPMLLGWRHPLILLPAGTVSRLTPSQLRAVLAHELAHVRRGDSVANAILIVAETLLFHHPGARWVSRRIRTEREYCCDDVAVTIGRDAEAYARALAALEDARGELRLVVAAASGTLLDRIQRIVGQPRPMLTPARGALALLVASALAAAMLAIAMSVPPSLPVGARLRRPGPPPNGVVLPPSEQQRLPRSPTR